MSADELSAQILENKECRPILTHVFNVKVQTQLCENEAKNFLFHLINVGRLNDRYYATVENWPNFGGAKITIK